jgi:peptidylprolyl isomerase
MKALVCPLLALPLLACVQRPVASPFPPAAPAAKPLNSAQVLEQSAPTDWRALDPENTLYFELASGRVVIELAPAFAPNHVANIKALVRQKYFDGLFVIRSQDNYVVQWGDPEEDERKQRPLGQARASLPPEFDRPAAELPFTVLADGDLYAPEAGHSGGFPAARDPGTGRAWLAHCYGALGVSRGNTADSGSGAGLYVVIGHAPRHLDRNITLAGRVVKGMELLSVLPRGTGPLGFYDAKKREQPVPIQRVRVAADVPERERTPLELLRTDTPTFTAYVDARRHRREEWFLDPVGHVELCNVPLPARAPAVR